MKKICLFAFIILGAVTSASIIPDNASAQKSRTRENPTFIPNHYIVLLDDNVVGTDAVEPEVETRGQFLTTVYGGAVTAVYSNAVKGFAVEMTADQAEKMKTDESVKLIEQDQVVTAASTEMNAPWHLDRVDQRSIPMDTMYNYSSMGTGVNIYLIDSGIRITHTDFGGRADVVFDGIGDGQDGIDCYGHGTRCWYSGQLHLWRRKERPPSRGSRPELQRTRIDRGNNVRDRLGYSSSRESRSGKSQLDLVWCIQRNGYGSNKFDKLRRHLFDRCRQFWSGCL